jgi:hypothetical protein
MPETTTQPDVSAPAGRLARPVALWGGGAALLAVSIAWNRDMTESSLFGVLTVVAAALAGYGVLLALRPRPLTGWAMPVLVSQMVRTMLAPAVGLGVFLLTDLDALGYWLSLLAVAVAMLVGETIAIAKMFGSARMRVSGQEAAA